MGSGDRSGESVESAKSEETKTTAPRDEAGARSTDNDSEGVYYMSIEDFERRRPPSPPPRSSKREREREREGEAGG